MSDEDWFKEYQKNVDSNAKWRSRKEQKALNDKWDILRNVHTEIITTLGMTTVFVHVTQRMKRKKVI